MSQSRENAEATSFAEAMENLDLKTPQQGELLRGTIVSISGDDAYISYGGPSEAVMDTAELEGLDIGDHDRSNGRQDRRGDPRLPQADQGQEPRSISSAARTRTAFPSKGKSPAATRAASK